jgi:hypothetical protein
MTSLAMNFGRPLSERSLWQTLAPGLLYGLWYGLIGAFAGFCCPSEPSPADITRPYDVVEKFSDWRPPTNHDLTKEK